MKTTLKMIGILLGVTKMKAKRFYSYLLGNVKNWDY